MTSEESSSHPLVGLLEMSALVYDVWLVFGKQVGPPATDGGSVHPDAVGDKGWVLLEITDIDGSC